MTGRDDEDRAWRLAQHVQAHSAQQHRRASAGSQDDELGVDLVRDLHDLPAGQTEDRMHLHAVCLVTKGVADRVAELRLSIDPLVFGSAQGRCWLRRFLKRHRQACPTYRGYFRLP